MEIEALLVLDVPARLATLDRDGFPHVTPLWFLWSDGAFYVTSIADRPHLRRPAANPRAGVLVDTEDAERDDGQRPNRQVRAIGEAEVFSDSGGAMDDSDHREVRLWARLGGEHRLARGRPARGRAAATRADRGGRQRVTGGSHLGCGYGRLCR